MENARIAQRPTPSSRHCYTDGDFYKYFKENMDGLGAPVPKGLFETYDKAISTAGVIAASIQAMGTKVTVAELVGAGMLTEMLMVAGAASAVGYLGAVVGSIFVAIGRTAGCGSRIADLFVFARQNNLVVPGTNELFARWPQLYMPSLSGKRAAGVQLGFSGRSVMHG